MHIGKDKKRKDKNKNKLHISMSEPDAEMLLLFEFLPEKNNTDKEKINRTSDYRMSFNVLPGLLHSFTPVNIIKNKNGICI